MTEAVGTATPRPWIRSVPAGVASGMHARYVAADTFLEHAGENWTSGAMHIVPHTHAGWELYLQLHGQAHWRLGPLRRTVTPGWLVAVPPGVPHGHDPAGSRWPGNHYLYAAFDPALLRERLPALASSWPARVRLSADGLALQPAFRLLLREARTELPHPGEGLAAALELLVVEATRIFAADPPLTEAAATTAVERARTLMDERPEHPWTVPQLAAEAGFSGSHLNHRFRAEVGIPPYRYLIERRVERCAALLRDTDRSIGQIARDAGFASTTVMGRAFKAVTGWTPSGWRSADGGSRRPQAGGSTG